MAEARGNGDDQAHVRGGQFVQRFLVLAVFPAYSEIMLLLPFKVGSLHCRPDHEAARASIFRHRYVPASSRPTLLAQDNGVRIRKFKTRSRATCLRLRYVSNTVGGIERFRRREKNSGAALKSARHTPSQRNAGGISRSGTATPSIRARLKDFRRLLPG